MSDGFKDLTVWRQSKELAVDIYKRTERGPFQRDFGLKDQVRRSAVSVPSNIAEGDERGGNKESVRFLYIAKGSLAELRTQLEISYEIGYISSEELAEFERRCSTIGRMLGSLIKVRAESLTHNS